MGVGKGGVRVERKGGREKGRVERKGGREKDREREG